MQAKTAKLIAGNGRQGNYNVNVLVSEFGEKRTDWVITKESLGEGFKSHCFWEQIVKIRISTKKAAH